MPLTIYNDVLWVHFGIQRYMVPSFYKHPADRVEAALKKD